MYLIQPLYDLASHANALHEARLDLLEVLCEQKMTLLALEAERHKFFLYTTNARVIASLLENEKLFHQLCLSKVDIFTQCDLEHRVTHKHLSHGESDLYRKVVAEHLEICSPSLRLCSDKNEDNDHPLYSTRAGINLLVVPMNAEFEIECSLSFYGDDNNKVWKEKQKRYLEGIHRIPFILTYISGDATLSEESNILAYAQYQGSERGCTQIVRFSRILLHHAKASSQHTFLITHPRTQYGIIQPLEVSVLTLAPPVIVIEELKYDDVGLGSGEMPLPMSDMELYVRASVKVDDIVSRVVLTYHKQHPNGEKYSLGISEIQGEECKECRVGNDEWCFHHHVPMGASDTLDLGGPMLLLVEVTLSSMQHHVFKESFRSTSSERRRNSLQCRTSTAAPAQLSGNVGKKTLLENFHVEKGLVSEKYRNPDIQGDAMGDSTALTPALGVSSASSDIGDLVYSHGENKNDMQLSTRTINNGEDVILLSSFILDKYGLLAATFQSSNSPTPGLPQLLWFTHSTTNAVRGDTHVPIKGLHDGMLQLTTNTCSGDSYLRASEWTLECCCDTSRKWLLREPRGGTIVLSPNESQTPFVESCYCCCFFPPTLTSPTNDDHVMEEFFVEDLQYLVQRWASGAIVYMDSVGKSRVVVNDSVAVCVWNPGDEEATNLVVLAHRGCRFSVYSLDDHAVILHCSLQVTADLSDDLNVQEYRGITPVLGGDSVLLWTSLQVEILSHVPVWTRRLLYKVESRETYITALCSAQYTSEEGIEHNEDTLIVSFLLLSDGTVLGLSLDGNTRLMGYLPSHDSLSSLSSSSSSSSSCLLGILTAGHITRVSNLMMRHVKLNEQFAICVCGLSEDHLLRCAYVS